MINPYTEYDKKFYDPSASNKEYLNDTSKIMVGFDNNQETELPSQAQYLASPHVVQGGLEGTIQTNMHGRLHGTMSDRSELGMSNATSVGMPGQDTIRSMGQNNLQNV